MTRFVGFEVLSAGEYKSSVLWNVRDYFIDVSKELMPPPSGSKNEPKANNKRS
jgi:hypothetical protein